MNLFKENGLAEKDPSYKNIQENWHKDGRACAVKEHVEEMYHLTKDVLDKNFCKKLKFEFLSRYAEMYFAATFIDKSGFTVEHPSDKGPDLFLKDLNCWVEVASVSDGSEENPNSIPKPVPGRAQEDPDDEIILRLTGALSKKSRAMIRYTNEGIVDSSSPIIICISGGAMSQPLDKRPVGGLPKIAHAVLPIGRLHLLLNKKTEENSWEYGYRENIKKKSENEDVLINTDYFLNDKHSHISAVICSGTKAGNATARDKWGSDFFTIHNPKAKNPLPKGFIKCGTEYCVSITANEFTIAPIEYEKHKQAKARKPVACAKPI